MTRELQPHEFHEGLEPIFRHVEREAGRTDGNSKYLFVQWQKWMELGLARTWADEGCVIGMLIHPHIFSGRLRAYISFWFSEARLRGSGRPRELLDVCEREAKLAGCEKISIAAYESLNPEKTGRIYSERGYKKSETVFTLDL